MMSYIHYKQKIDKKFVDPIFKKFYKLLSPKGPKFQFPKKVFPTTFLLTEHVS